MFVQMMQLCGFVYNILEPNASAKDYEVPNKANLQEKSLFSGCLWDESKIVMHVFT